MTRETLARTFGEAYNEYAREERLLPYHQAMSNQKQRCIEHALVTRFTLLLPHGEVSCPICGARMQAIESERYDSKGVPQPAWMCPKDHRSEVVGRWPEKGSG